MMRCPRPHPDHTGARLPWVPFHDSLLFLAYSMRTGKLDAAALFMSQLARIIPGGYAIRVFNWFPFLVETRPRLSNAFRDLPFYAHISFPTFCCWLAATEWSLPLLKAVHADLNDLSGFCDYSLYYWIFLSYFDVDDPNRFIPVLTILRDEGGVGWSAHCPMLLKHKKPHFPSFDALVRFFGWDCLGRHAERVGWVGGCMLEWEAKLGTTAHVEEILKRKFECVDWNKPTPTCVWKEVGHLLPQEEGL